MQVLNRNIGDGTPTFVIAEVGINHNGNMDDAIELIRQAKTAGADAVKLQTYLTEKRVSKDSPIFSILKQCELTFEQQERLFLLAAELDIVLFSTPFDSESVDFLESIQCPLYKIASFDSVNKKLLNKVSQCNKPVIMSTGMTNFDELEVAMDILLGDNGSEQNLAILHCISSYPTKPEDANLSAINVLKKIYNGSVGYSDHTIGTEVPAFAVAAGAQIIEKHFTLDTSAEGPDHSLSADPHIFKEMIIQIRNVEKIMGQGNLGVRPAETDIVQYRRES